MPDFDTIPLSCSGTCDNCGSGFCCADYQIAFDSLGCGANGCPENGPYFNIPITNNFNTPAIMSISGSADDGITINGKCYGPNCDGKGNAGDFGTICIQVDAGETVMIGALQTAGGAVAVNAEIYICPI